MEEFCGSELWDWGTTWYTDSPSFTLCFEKSVLIWVPCSFFIVCSIIGFMKYDRSNYREIPFGWLNVSKIIGVSVLIFLSFLDTTYAVIWYCPNMKMYPVDFVTGTVKVITFLLLNILLMKNRFYGIRTSATAFFFWLLLVPFALPQYLSLIVMAFNNKESLHLYPYISNVVYFSVVVSMLLLELFVDSRPVLSLRPPIRNPPRQENVSYVNNQLLLWYDYFAFGHYGRTIDKKHLWGLEYEDTVAYLIPNFYENWWKQVKAINKKLFTSKANAEKVSSSRFQKFSIDSKSFHKRKEINLITVLAKCFLFTQVSLFLQILCVDVLHFVGPLMLNLLITFEDNDNEPIWHGYSYVVGIILSGVAKSLIRNNYGLLTYKFGLQMRTTLMVVIFRKVLKISNGAKKIFSVGDISNLMSVDAQRFIELSMYMNMSLSSPLIIGLCLYFLWQLIGISALASVIMMLILIPINGYAANKVKVYQTRQMKYKDKRVKITNEVLAGIKVLKMHAWESSFDRKITEIRNQEIKMLRFTAYLNTAISFVWTTAPYLVSLVTFAVFTLIDENNVLTTNVALVSLSLLNIMKIGINFIPKSVTNVTQAYVSAKRINKFLNANELDDNVVTHDNEIEFPLLIENGTFIWDEDDDIATLQNINLKVTEGSLVAVVGRVGSGKSSLLFSFLGEMHKLTGCVNTKGTIAYVSQQPWLQNATLRDNILFMKPYTKELYDKVVESCALIPDFQILPGSDLTEIGEKGVNLSGGQKQRISLARSVYNDANIYLLDDPLSAVDAHVGKHIFTKVIGPNGLLKNKTRLLVTNSITYLTEVDYIVVMKDGTITEAGTYNELLFKKAEFADYIQNFSSKHNFDLKNDAVAAKMQCSEESSDIIMAFSINNKDCPNFPDKTIHHKPSIIGDKLIEAERIEEGQVKWMVYFHYFKAGGILFWLLAIFFNLLYQIFSVMTNLWLTEWSAGPDVIANHTRNSSTSKYYYLVIYTIYGIGQIITVILASLTMYLATTTASSNLHKKVLEKVLHWPTYVFDVTPLGRILNRFAYDIDVIDNTFPVTLNLVFNYSGILFAAFFVITYSSPVFVIFAIPIVFVYLILQQVFVNVMRQLQRLESVSRTPVFSHFSETITGATTIRSFGMTDNFITESERRIYEYQICNFPNIQARKWIGLRLDCLAQGIIFVTSMFAVVYRGTKQADVLCLAITYAMQITMSLDMLLRVASDTETNIVSVERIIDLENYPEEKLQSPHYEVPPKRWPRNGVIIFDKYKTRYRDGLNNVLHGIDLKIESGEKVGIVGRTGAGKSSLTLSLFRIIEAAEGRIIIDGIDISQIELQILRSRITIIPQDSVLFSGTVRLNLDPFFEHSDEELWRILTVAHLKEFVSSLPLGLEFFISENGGNLSIGQRQLICLARALLRKTKILVLDEATAAIDLETDELIQKTIRHEFKDCTVLTIAHKLNTVMDSDRIVVLDHGLVKEFDTPTNLLQLKTSLFYSMAKETGLVL